jgi:uncharacterized protein
VIGGEFATTLGRVLHRPAIAPLPGLAIKALFGEMGEATLLASQRVLPKALEGSGFSFVHPTLEAAFRFHLGR